MDKALPFVDFFPNIYPKHRVVNPQIDHGLIGVMIKSVMYSRYEEALLCRGLVIEGRDVDVYTSVNLKVTGISPVVGYDLELFHDQNEEQENWEVIRNMWSAYFASEPVHVQVLHEDIKKKVNAMVFPIKRIRDAARYIGKVKGALTFGDFCPDRGYYLDRDGNTPALLSSVMFGRVYFVPRNKLNSDLLVSDLVYDHNRSEMEARQFDEKHMAHFYKAACLDIETVYNNDYRDPSLHCDSFAYRFPYCTEQMVAEMSAYRTRLVCALNAGQKQLPKQAQKVVIPALAPDMPGQQHEITCISLVVINSHVTKMSSVHHRKELIVLYNKCKVKTGERIQADSELALRVGIDDVRRIQIYPCTEELGVLEHMLKLLRRNKIELLYVYNAEFDIRVIEQRVHFYAQAGANKQVAPTYQRRCTSLLQAWYRLFVTEDLSASMKPLLQFENPRYLQMYKDMLTEIGSVLLNGDMTEYKLRLISMHIQQFNKEKAKVGHLKMNSCGMNIIDLYRMAGTRATKFACTSGKLNDVVPFLIKQVRDLNQRPPKDSRKLCKVADVGFSKMDQMISLGGKNLFAVLVYNLVDSQLCARLAKVLRPVASLFHRCRITLNIDVLVHGRGDMFVGFIQSIHSVQLPQLKFKVDNLRVQAGPMGSKLADRLRWNIKQESDITKGDCGMWQGGAVCNPLTGQHYSGPGMGLELSFDFSGMYPSIMCALNISPETTIPWPPVAFPHDLSGWVCYRWEAEGFEYASLILKYDPELGQFVRQPAVFACSLEHYLTQRTDYKTKMKNPNISEAEGVYFKIQEGECKVLANSFYGTAPQPCGPLISGHGRQQIAIVNSCVSAFYKHHSPVIYGDTDSVMLSVGYGPGEAVENELPNVVWGCSDKETGVDGLRDFSHEAIKAVLNKFDHAAKQVPAFLEYVHKALVEDTLERMYFIGDCNSHQKVIRDPKGSYSKQGFPVYVVQLPGTQNCVDVTRPFVKNRRIKLEHENSCSVYCHVSKKAYVALTHNLDSKGSPLSQLVKVRGVTAIKSMRSPCDTAVLDTFIACVMRGDCIKLETTQVSCFSTTPWHQLKTGDMILYFEQEPQVDKDGHWLEWRNASTFLTSYIVQEVMTLPLDSGYCGVSVTLLSSVTKKVGSKSGDSLESLTVRTLYKDWKYCMNHIFSYKEAILRDLLMYKASELIASKMGAGFFPWSSLIKAAKIKNFSQETLDRLAVSNQCIKASYTEIVRTRLREITGLSVQPTKCHEFYKCNPCDVAFYRYPLNLGAGPGCMKSMFGHSLMCEAREQPVTLQGGINPQGQGDSDCAAGSDLEDYSDLDDGSDLEEDSDNCNGNVEVGRLEPKLRPVNSSGRVAELISHPYLPFTKCFSNSRVLLAHCADYELVNTCGKLTAHCIIDLCLPRHMYSPALDARSLKRCEELLLVAVASIRERLEKARLAFHSLMNNCPEHMIPTLESRELEHLRFRRENVTRLPGEKLQACFNVIVSDMSLQPRDLYSNLIVSLGKGLTEAIAQGVIAIEKSHSTPDPYWNASIVLTVPWVILRDAGIVGQCERILIARSELRENTLVDLAGLLYQTVLAMQLYAPENFSTATGVYPESILFIMPFSCVDENLIRNWVEVFKKRKWQTHLKATLGKRRYSYTNTEVNFHCTGCKNFYMDLFANHVPGHRLIQYVYGEDNRRKIGMCVSERWWLSKDSI